MQCCHSMANIKICKCNFTHFCASSNSFRNIIQRRLKFFTLIKLIKVTEYNFHSGVIRLQISKSVNVFYMSIFYKIRSVRMEFITKTDKQTDRQTATNRETDKVIAIGEIAEMPKKLHFAAW